MIADVEPGRRSCSGYDQIGLVAKDLVGHGLTLAAQWSDIGDVAVGGRKRIPNALLRHLTLRSSSIVDRRRRFVRRGSGCGVVILSSVGPEPPVPGERSLRKQAKWKLCGSMPSGSGAGCLGLG
jgi:hypothetical protein